MLEPTEPASILVLRWAVKRSLVRYVQRLADGVVAVSAEVRVVDGDELVFPLTSATAASGCEQLQFAGEIRFQGYGGLLSVALADPLVTVQPDGGGLSVRDPFTEGAAYVPVVVFGSSAEPVPDAPGARIWRDVRLLPSAVELFGEVYEAGEPFEAVRVESVRRAAGSGSAHRPVDTRSNHVAP